ncbi:MAG: PIN domain-containing protein [Chloroflexota bacterium]
MATQNKQGVADRPVVFLDTSALFAGVWSTTGGGRLILKLGEAGIVRLLVSSLVLKELEKTLLAKAPHLLGASTLLMDMSHIEITLPPLTEVVQRCQAFTTHPGDAEVLAAAWAADVDYFVTLDQKHFLNNLTLGAAAPFIIGTPGDFITWYRGRYQA